MTAPRSRRETLEYRRHAKHKPATECGFCAIEDGQQQVVSGTGYFYVVKNIFPYSLWDSQNVADHLMIVPKRHIDRIGDFTDKESVQYLKLLAQYEATGYNFYARAPGSVMKTVLHQHTHLIKPGGSVRKFVFLLRKPYIRFVA